MRFTESPATEEENSFDYIVEWDDKINYDDTPVTHEGPGSLFYKNDYDGAWEAYNNLKKPGVVKFVNIRIRQVDSK